MTLLPVRDRSRVVISPLRLPERVVIRSYPLPLNDERVKEFIDFYTMIVIKTLEEIWVRAKIERQTRGRREIRMTIPKDKESKKVLRDKLEAQGDQHQTRVPPGG